MEDMQSTNDRSSSRKAIIPALLLIMLSALFFYKDSVLNFFGGEKKAELAEITESKNDVRRKDSKSIDFLTTKKQEKIYHGDSLSTGSSSTAQVTFNTGQVLNVDQNSLIIFDEVSDTPEFVKGNIKLTVKGKMKVKIDNEIVELDGKQGESSVQIYKDEKAKVQKIVLLKGDVQIKTPSKKEVVSLQRNIPVEPKKVIRAEEMLKSEPTAPVTAAVANQPVVIPQRAVAASGNYKLYDYYERMLSSNYELGRNHGFTPKPNANFEKFTPSSVAIAPQPTTDTDPAKNPYTIRINDPEKAPGYVVEVSPQETFPDGQTQYHWKSAYFSQNFAAPGTYFVRYRKVKNGQVLTDYSPTERVVVPEKPKPVVVKPVEPPKVEPKPVPKKVVVKPVPVKKMVVVEKPKPVVQERKVAAVPPEEPIHPQSMQSTVKTAPADLTNNQNYTLSMVGISAGQSLMASGLQLANSNPVGSSYGLQVNGLYWMDRNGFSASYSKALSASNSQNLVSSAELSYLRRFYLPWSWMDGGRFQYHLSLGFQNYKNSSATSDYVDSYNLYKLGLGASMPIFTFWTLDGQMAYGFGSSKTSSLMFGGRANYFLKKNLSLGLGFRAQKYDYYLLNQQNSESLSETYTILNMYY